MNINEALDVTNKESKKLYDKVKILFADFCGSKNISGDININKKEERDKDDFYGFIIEEQLHFSDSCDALTITRHRLLEPDGDFCQADDSYTIELGYGDGCYWLTHGSEYYCKMTNKVIIEQVKVLFKTADKLFKKTVEINKGNKND